MSVTVTGIPALERRLQAVAGVKGTAALMRKLGEAAVQEQKALVPRKTGILGRSIVLGTVTPTSAVTRATANYAAYVEFGTKGGTIITPKNARVLAWPTGGAGGAFARLSGNPRKGISRSGMAFAMRVKRGATRPEPFMVPGAKAAISRAGLADLIVAAWDGAA